MADINELRQKRAALIQSARSILDEAEKREDPTFSAEESNKYNAIMADVDKLTDRIKKEEQLRELEKVEIEKRLEEKQGTGNPPAPGKNKETRVDPRSTDEYRESFARFLQTGETRALQVDSDTQGGYIVAPLQMVNTIIQELDNMLYVRRISTVYSVPNADSLGAPSLDNDPADPTWTNELSIGSEDTTMSFGKRELKPHPLAQFIKVSNTLLRKAMMGPEALVTQRLTYKMNVVHEKAFMTGSGAMQPLGVFTASDNGISTSRDVSTGNTTTEIRTNGLQEVKFSLKKQYRQSGCVWVFHRDAIKQIAKLKDGEGRYIWNASIIEGEPDRLLGYPVYESEYAPNTFTTGLYVGILGNFTYYWIADSLNMTIQRLVELYAAANQTGYIARTEMDAMPVLESAFSRVKLA